MRRDLNSFLRRGAAFLALCTGLTGAAQAQPFEPGYAPLEGDIYEVPGIAVADTMPKGTWQGHIGQLMADRGNAGGTGKQLYFYGIDVATSDRLQFGVEYTRHADPAVIAGVEGSLKFQALSFHGKYKIAEFNGFTVSARAAGGYFYFSSDYYDTNTDGHDQWAASFHLPVSYEISPRLTFHLTPGVTVYPDELKGREFYGVVPSLGAGATLRASERLAFYGSVNMPFGDSGNTVMSDGSVDNVPIWTVGGRYLVSPQVALDVYLTNGFGTTPLTEIQAFIPDGEEPVLGFQMTYTPGHAPNYRSNYRGIRPLTERERHLQFRGLTLASADTLDPGMVLLTGAYGTDDHASFGGVFAPTYDMEIGYYVERLSDDGSRSGDRTVGREREERYMAVGKLRFMDQNNGSPFSMSANVQAGREFVTRFGVFYASLPMSYKFANGLAVTAEPKAAGFSDERLVGLGLGANYELWRGLEVIAEVTPMSGGDDPTWSLGARYHVPDSSISFEAQATNTIGNYGVGTMIAQDEVRYSVGVNVALDAGRFWEKLF
ncbi:hypothetical protein [Psychromarinibacter halotolerans]|uniref:Uncharacterized protein n=1 Tax=Psychromarinibacter halotolerans TaxID=1775175 RepID=A0ABV7GSV0_9RHOB|nr:hypothetical protein [Psychromarinibacter halotolerans]MDF0594489.1 hypothetical protein [Psychromarinibacter halotolerans]